MLKSLFSGVAGLQSHQIAMDVESNNIANVNTIGFKYSRANFSDLLAQTSQIATAPQGSLGGKNAVQVGLGTTVASITRIHTQGSIQNTDKNTDVAIQGDGFFVVSSDGGNTYKFTRSGDFKFDANGNFVDNNGFVTQGWLRDEATGLVDSTAPIQNIVIPPGLTTPASATKQVDLKANLNSGSIVTQLSPTYPIDTNGNVLDTDGNIIPPTAIPAAADLGVGFNADGRAFDLKTGQGLWASFQSTLTATGNTGTLGAGAGTINAGDITVNGVAMPAIILPGPTSDANVAAVVTTINSFTSQTGVVATPAAAGSGQFILRNDNGIGTTATSKNIVFVAGGTAAGAGLTSTTPTATAFEYRYDPNFSNNAAAGVSPKIFTNVNDLRAAMQAEVQAVSVGATVTVASDGKIIINNVNGANSLTTSVTGLSDLTTLENEFFAPNFQSLNGTLNTGIGNVRASQPINAAVHSSSLDVFDSLGSKHTVIMEFRKISQTASTGATWSFDIVVPNPATIVGSTAPNLNTLPNGTVTFDSSGAMTGVNPSFFDFIGNNGSVAPQTIDLNFGTFNAFDGLTSFDRPSATSGISQDGFPGGDLLGIRIDQTGTLVGSFSNGRSFGLGQLAMAKFVNNEGLAADGGNVYLQSANSGDAIIGTAATGGRGFMQSAALEASNVDLSRSLTQLIIIQRGFQANGKTITTSDQLLNTLINLKN